MYASSVDPDILRDDLRFASWQQQLDIPLIEAVKNLTADHIRRIDAESPVVSLAERYSAYVTEVVRQASDQSAERLLAGLQPSTDDRGHWEPALSTLGPAQADLLTWRREHGDIQSYQQIIEPKGWIHLDGGRQFFDRTTRVISAEQALTPLGISVAEKLDRNMVKLKERLPALA